MLRITIVLILILLLFSCSEREIPDSEIVEKDGLIYAKSDIEPHTGKVHGEYDSHRIKYSDSYSAGKLHGLSTRYYENDEKMSEKRYENGEKHNSFYTYYQSGRKRSKKVYHEGLQEGRTVYWDKDDKAIEYLEYDSVSNDISWKTGQGRWDEIGNEPYTGIVVTYYRNHQIRNKITYEEGEYLRSESRYWREDGAELFGSLKAIEIEIDIIMLELVAISDTVALNFFTWDSKNPQSFENIKLYNILEKMKMTIHLDGSISPSWDNEYTILSRSKDYFTIQIIGRITRTEVTSKISLRGIIGEPQVMIPTK